MRSTEFAPLFRSTVGFDRLFDMLENSVRPEWPPYNIEKQSENAYRITMAIAGFRPDEVELTQNGAELTVIGRKKPEDNAPQLLHRGLAVGNFKQAFRLADYVKVANASLENGLLIVDLERELPEEMKPRRIAITSVGYTPRIETAGQIEQVSQDSPADRQAA
jgi:molecular chaperone IbpA